MFADQTVITHTLFRAIAVALGIAPDSSAAAARILRAYADPPPPQAAADSNLCFFNLTPDPGARMLTERKVIRGKYAVYRFIPCSLVLVFYGPSAETDTFTVRENLFVDGANRPLAMLRKVGIYPVPPGAPPSVIYEEDGSLFRKRADLVIPARLLDNSDDAASGGSVVLDGSLVEMIPEVIVNKTE